jgi:dipeptidyl aminopeptidase/acylaminoacyl peptidase
VFAAVSAAAQDGATFPVPSNVKVEGLPPIPASIADRFLPYGEYRSADLLSVHPTRRQILIATTFGPRWHIHAVDGPGRARTQLTFGPAINRVAAFEPTKGEYFVFVRDVAAGGELPQLFRYDLATGAVTMITDGKSRNGGNALAWSGKAGLLAFDSNRRTGKDRDIWVVNPADPSMQRMVFQSTGNWYARDWSPDGAELLVEEAVGGGEQYIWRVNVQTGEKTPVTPRDERASWSGARFSADGRAVYALSSRAGEALRLWRGDLTSGKWTQVTPDDRIVESYSLSPDGRTIAVVSDRDAASVLELIDATTSKVRHTPKVPTGVVTRLAWHRNGQELLFNLATIHAPNDVYSVAAATGVVGRWTFSEIGGANPQALPPPEIVRWKSFDGLTISGILYRPSARFTGPRPVLINIHGGPDSRVRPGFIGRSGYYLNELGVAIVYPNVRGSTGFGRAFVAADNGKLREDSVKDVGALLDWIAQQPGLDKNRVVVLGASAGGYLAYATAVMYGDRIRGAIPIAGVSNFVSYLQQTEPVRLQNRRAEYGDERDPEMNAFLKLISPVTNASKIRAPLLIMHGRKDPRVPVEQAEEMARLVRANGVPVWTVIFEDEGHEFTNAANNDFSHFATIMFVRQFLLK